MSTYLHVSNTDQCTNQSIFTNMLCPYKRLRQLQFIRVIAALAVIQNQCDYTNQNGLREKTITAAGKHIILPWYPLRFNLHQNVLGRIKFPCSKKLRLHVQRPWASPKTPCIRLTHYHPPPCSKVPLVHESLSQDHDYEGRWIRRKEVSVAL